MLIEMLSTQPGSINGITSETYVEGEQYDLSGSQGAEILAGIFIRAGWAKKVGCQDTVAASEESSDMLTFDLEAADAKALKAFLLEKKVSFHHKLGVDKLRDKAREVLACDK